MRHSYEPKPLDIRCHADEEVIGEAVFVPDPFDAEALRTADERELGRIRLDVLNSRKKAHGRAAHKAAVIYQETGVWVR